jgi:transposase InsO family protein
VKTGRVRAMGIRDRPIAPRSPWQNGHVGRLVGTIRRECLDHLVISVEAHLRPMLQAYAAYYNEIRTHPALGKQAPKGSTLTNGRRGCGNPGSRWAASSICSGFRF